MIKRYALFFGLALALCAAPLPAPAQHGANGENDNALQRYLAMQRQAMAIQASTEKNGDIALLERTCAWQQAQLTLDKARLVAFNTFLADYRKREILGIFQNEFARQIEAVRTNTPIERPLAGLHELAYLSPQDGSAQPYYVYVPESAAERIDAGGRVPLVLFLHGYVSYMDKINWFDLSRPDALMRLADTQAFIVALPFGRSNTEFMGIGEVDVLQVIDEVSARYAIDDDRIILTGISMGGSGAWTIAAHYPHRFAGMLSIAGRTDYYLWKRHAPDRMPPHQRWLTDVNYVASMPQNFRNMGVYISHGQFDNVISPEQSTSMAQRLRHYGIDPVLDLVPGGDHYVIWSHVFSQPGFAKWLNAQRRNRWPSRITHTVYSPKYGRAYWATIEKFETFGRPASIDVRVEPPSTIHVASTNVARLRLEVDGPALGLRGAITIRSDSLKAPANVTLGESAQTVLLAQDGYAELPEGVVKTHGASPGAGPICEAYNGPFIMVYGAGSKDGDAPASRRLAELNAAHWNNYAKGIPAVKPHTAVTKEDVRTKNLILFGTAEDNPLIARIYEADPAFAVRAEGGAITVGSRKYEGEDIGAIVIRPNPLNPKRYVAIHSGVPWGLALETNHRFGFLPDFIVFQKALAPDNTNHALCAGFFGNRWELQDDTTWTFPPAPENARFDPREFAP